VSPDRPRQRDLRAPGDDLGPGDDLVSRRRFMRRVVWAMLLGWLVLVVVAVILIRVG